MTMFPCHMCSCCDENMTEGDVVATDSVRRDVDRTIMDLLLEQRALVSIVI
jgi:hypothetical protein